MQQFCTLHALLTPTPDLPPPPRRPSRLSGSASISGAACGSGVARNFRQRVRQYVAFLSVHSPTAALPSRPYNQKTRIKSHTKKLCIFLTGGVHHLYGYTTGVWQQWGVEWTCRLQYSQWRRLGTIAADELNSHTHTPRFHTDMFTLAMAVVTMLLVCVMPSEVVMLLIVC